MIQLNAQENPYQANMLAFMEDKESFARLYRQYCQSLHRFAVRLVQSPELAEEIVSDVFVKIWKNREQVAIKTSMDAYLHMAVRNQSIDYLRKRIRKRGYSDEIQSDYPSDYQNPEDDAICNELEQLIEAAIDSLPPQGQKVFRLSRDCGMKYHEIATHLNLSIKTVETHMGRSLKFLREKIQTKIN